jgi:hypothetical protein
LRFPHPGFSASGLCQYTHNLEEISMTISLSLDKKAPWLLLFCLLLLAAGPIGCTAQLIAKFEADSLRAELATLTALE